MASRWLVNSREGSWFTFGELVTLARSGELSQDHLVKAEWDPDWRPAHSVVGLFYRAKRSEPVIAADPQQVLPPVVSESDSGFRMEDLEAAQELQSAEEIESSNLAGWQKRLHEVQETRSRELMHDEPTSTQTSSSAMQLLFEAAMPQKRGSPWRQRVERWGAIWNMFYEWLNTTSALRLVVGAVVAAFSGWGFFYYSRLSALRFPRPDMPDRFIVPILGDCTPGEFYFILAEFVILCMSLIYFGGMSFERWLASRSRYSQDAG